MDKLINFLQKEVPGHADNLQNSIYKMLEEINYILSALGVKVSILYQEGKIDEMVEFNDVNKKLFNMKKYLQEIIDDTQQEKNIQDVQKSFDIKIEELDNEIANEDIVASKTDYSRYRVDNTISYKLSKELENTTPYSFTFVGKTYRVSSYLQMWVRLCEILYKYNKDLFFEIATNHLLVGRKKVYIVCKDDPAIKNMIKPLKLLGNSIIYESNTSTTQKVSIILKMLDIYNIPSTDICVNLDSDRRPRHGQNAIGRYINSEQSQECETKLKDETSSKEYKNKPEITTSQMAYNYFQKYFEDTSKHYNIENFLNEKWCAENLGISFPLLKQIDTNKDLREQTIYKDKKYASYAQNSKYLINGKTYIICMIWNKTCRAKLDVNFHDN